MPVTVPIVSKKSDSMIAKMVSSAVSTPSLANAWNGSCRPSPSVEKLGVTTSGLGMVATPTMSAMTVVARMLMINAARILRTKRMIVIARPMRKTT